MSYDAIMGLWCGFIAGALAGIVFASWNETRCDHEGCIKRLAGKRYCAEHAGTPRGDE